MRRKVAGSENRVVASLQDAAHRPHPPTPHCATSSLVRGYWDFVPLARGEPKCALQMGHTHS